MTFLSRLGLLAAAFLFTLGPATLGKAVAQPQDYQLGFQKAVTPVAERIASFHDVLLVIITLITVFVLVLLLWVMYRFSEKRNPTPSKTTHHVGLELAWTVIPVLILIAMAFPATKTLLDMRDTSAPDMTVKVTGYQWKWGYDYLDEGIQFYSTLSTPREQIEAGAEKGENYLLEVDNPMVVPVGKRVRVLITANDVLHSWYVPELTVKQDAVPGFIRDAWFQAEKTGTFRGQCAELCGREHGFMPIVVNVVSEDEYQIWVANQKSGTAVAAHDPGKTYTVAELRSTGEAVYNEYCVTCHQPDGKGMPPTFPAITAGKITTGPIAGHIDLVVNGSKKNPMMVAWGAQLSDTEIAAVITYQRNALGNAVGDAVQPSAIAAARQ